jgi:uncharacterized protein
VTRVLIDANVLISYLLNPTGDGPPSTLIRAAAAGRVTPVVSPRLIQEVSQRVALSDRVPTDRIDRLAQILTKVGEFREDADMPYPAVTRDHKDDYLVANAVIFRVDYLISGDHDLLELGEFEGVRIVDPATFAALLDDLS